MIVGIVRQAVSSTSRMMSLEFLPSVDFVGVAFNIIFDIMSLQCHWNRYGRQAVSLTVGFDFVGVALNIIFLIIITIPIITID